MKKSFLLVTGLMLLFSLTGCFAGKDMFKAREAFADKKSGRILIGIPGPVWLMKDTTGFLNGVMMAVEEINSNNGIAGRLIETRVVDDKGTFADGIKVAQDFAGQEDMAAVIGHWNSYITIPVAKIYNDAGLVMLSPVVSNTELTKKGYKFVFRNTISDYEMGRQMADYAKYRNYKRIVTFYADNDYGRGLANAFEDGVRDNGGFVVDRVTEFVNDMEFNKAYDKWKALDYDAVFIADSMPHAGGFIKKLREKDTKIPVFAGDGLDIAGLPSMLGIAAEGIVVATMYNPQNSSDKLNKFINEYAKKYNAGPDVWAVQGYDSIKLLTYAIEKAKSPNTSAIAEVLHNTKEWEGTLGTIGFNQNGEMTGRSIHKKIVKDGKFEYIIN